MVCGTQNQMKDACGLPKQCVQPHQLQRLRPHKKIRILILSNHSQRPKLRLSTAQLNVQTPNQLFIQVLTSSLRIIFSSSVYNNVYQNFFVVDPFDCSAYHFCNGGKDKVLKCEPGLYYDKSRDICDWRKNVNCKFL